MFNKKIKLPTTPDAFDKLVHKLATKYKFTDTHHVAAVISVAIRHLPATQAYSTLDYFGQYVSKAIANSVADFKNKQLRHEGEIDQLASLLRNDPNDVQARDRLQLAANEGSDYASKVLQALEPHQVVATANS